MGIGYKEDDSYSDPGVSRKDYPEVTLRLTGKQHKKLEQHLFPGDGKEAVCLVLCGRRTGTDYHILTVRKIIPVPEDAYIERAQDKAHWSTEFAIPHLEDADENGQAVLKIHSHPTGYRGFSGYDDTADEELFPSVHGRVPGYGPHASAVMLPDGEIFGRAAWPGPTFKPLRKVSVVGENLRFWFSNDPGSSVPDFAQRHAQAFGKKTTSLLGQLSVGVVGCSGTGSPVVEQLARLGVGELVLVDPDVVEEKNLNRILGASRSDVGRAKTEVMGSHIREMGLDTKVEEHEKSLFNANVIRGLARCDVVFGCMDSAEGRDLLNKVAVYYEIPYLDIGVRLDADQDGGIEHITGSVHYLQPDGSSLLSRGAITHEQVRAENLRRTNPNQYAQEKDEGYVRGVDLDRPAVISVNMTYASLAVNELLARLHPYRISSNSEHARVMMSLSQMRFIDSEEEEPCRQLASHAGKGDVSPLLDTPALSV